MEVHFHGVATEKEMKHLRKTSKNTQIFLVIILLMFLYFKDMLHQQRTQFIEKDLKHSLKLWKLRMTASVQQTSLSFSLIALTKKTS